jgi:hypothetical protein
LKERVDLIEKSYSPYRLNLHFDNLVRADSALFEALLSIGHDAWDVIQINQSWKTSYWFYNLFLLIRRASVRVLNDKTQNYISKDVIVRLALLLIEISQITTTPEYSGDITKRNQEALANLLLTFTNISNFRKVVITRSKEINNQNVINFAKGTIEWARKIKKE